VPPGTRLRTTGLGADRTASPLLDCYLMPVVCWLGGVNPSVCAVVLRARAERVLCRYKKKHIHLLILYYYIYMHYDYAITITITITASHDLPMLALRQRLECSACSVPLAAGLLSAVWVGGVREG